MRSNTAYAGRGASTARKGIRIIVILLILGLGIFFYWKYYFTYSDGNRYGLLQKFSRRGNVFKTYEGEMILSSVRGNANMPVASEKFFFSVNNERVAQQLMTLQGHSVTVHYKEKKGTLAWRGDTNYIVDSVNVNP
ncbi:MAG: hypothetical protein JWP27_1242 [Flaviaesturariibacter sp.]|nr:hypothetical protein [Flaviaesturariibacter sp.]